MDWIGTETFQLRSSAFAEVFAWRKTIEGFDAAPEIVGAHEVGQMCFEPPVTVAVIAFDGSFLDFPVHALDLAVGPWVLDFG